MKYKHYIYFSAEGHNGELHGAFDSNNKMPTMGEVMDYVNKYMEEYLPKNKEDRFGVKSISTVLNK